MWVVPSANLSEDQFEAVRLSTDKHRIVIGGPGAGKTLVLAHRTRRILDDGADPARVRLLVYTNLLTQYLRAGLNDLGIPEEAVDTFDRWCRRLHVELVGTRIPMSGGGPDFERIRADVLGAMRKKGGPPPYTAILVDEAQDLDETALELLKVAAEHVTIAMDTRQQIYGTTVDVPTAERILGVRRAQGALLTAYRCTQLIVDVASVFLPEDEVDRFRRANLMELTERELPVLEELASDAAELEVLAERLTMRLTNGETAAVLVPLRERIAPMVEALTARGIDAVGMLDATFTDTRPVVATYHSAKGLTVDAVFLPGLTASFPVLGDPTLVRNRIFVAITRATKWVWFGTRKDGGLPAVAGFDRFDELVRRGSLQRLPARAASRPAAPPSQPAPDGAEAPSLADLL
jgi:superfamily I DNA/RNA helicase